MDTSIIGAVVVCSHCKGTGKCNCSVCLDAAKVFRSSCLNVTCTTCGGAGSVWVGPQNVTIM